MAKSYTEKKSSFLQAQQTFTEFSVKYIKNWTEQELKKYRTEPVVIPIGDHGFLVGNYKITGICQGCWVVEQIDGKKIHEFTSKVAAVVYCLLAVKKKYSGATDVLTLDYKLGKLESDILHYRHSLDSNQNQFKTDIVLNRYIDAKIKRRAILNNLKKTLNSAKYLNFGNEPL